jgi:uncharacterized Tic20 family protein
MNNEISQKLRLIAAATHMVGAVTAILFFWLPLIVINPSGNTFIVGMMSTIIFQPIVVLFWWRVTIDSHPFIDRSGRDAFNCAVNTLLGTTVTTILYTFIFSGGGSQDPILFFISLFILSCVELAYFMNSVIAGIFTLRGYSFKSKLIYPFIKDR